MRYVYCAIEILPVADVEASKGRCIEMLEELSLLHLCSLH